MPRHTKLADTALSVLLVIDLQESYRDKLHQETRVVAGAARLLQAATILGVPVVVTEQYPERLGITREEIAAHVPDTARKFPKRSFSCLGADGLAEHLRSLGRDQVVVAGIETHVCVLQTALDGLAAGYAVHIAEDGCGSREQLNHEVGLRRAQEAGAVVTCVESLLFEWMERFDVPNFKSVIELLK